MKHFIFLFSLLIFSSSLYCQWEILNDGGDYQTIDFINDQVGWIAGEGTLLKTVDGGDTWEVLLTDSIRYFRKIDFVNESVGWAITLYGEYVKPAAPVEIIKTIDGGYTWEIQRELSSTESRVFDLLYAINDTLVYATDFAQSDSQKIIRTTDGGNTWIDTTPNNRRINFNSITFLDNKNGIVLGTMGSRSTIFKTDDGGDIWNEQVISWFTTMNSLQFINDSTAYFLASKNKEEYTEYSFCRTTDTLNTWKIRSTNHYGISSFYCLDDMTIFSIMTDSLGGSNIMKSIDGGITWEKKEELPGTFWEDGEANIYFRNVDVGFLVGNLIGVDSNWSLTFFSKTTNSGENWKIQKLNYPALIYVFFINENSGFAVGKWIVGCAHGCSYKGDLFTTHDGGKTWAYLFGNYDIINSIYFANDSFGFLSAQNIIYKTIDKGANWVSVYTGNPDSTGHSFSGKDLYFLNDDIGWAVGSFWTDDSSGAGILETKDVGESWGLIWKYPSGEWNFSLNSIYTTESAAWAVGESGMIVKYSEEEQWHIQPSFTDLPLNDVFFSDEQHGWIAGGYSNPQDFQSILFMTNNGGTTWSENRFDKHLINDTFFTDSLRGWAVGSDRTETNYWPEGSGVILKTSDGGNTWITQVEELSASLNAIYFKDGLGWAVGENGLVLRTDNWTTWIDQSTGETYPSKYSLSQNYPNPFNPITNIEYSVRAQHAVPQHVNLSIYNILGQKVATLVNKKQAAGSYKVQWDATGFASGIYIYQLTANGQQQNAVLTKKLILVK